MEIKVKRKKTSFLLDRWEWKLFVPGSRYPEDRGDAFTLGRAIKKARNRIPWEVKVDCGD